MKNLILQDFFLHESKSNNNIGTKIRIIPGNNKIY
jgi:hypothetical protein